jgi:hypothetical protein
MLYGADSKPQPEPIDLTPNPDILQVDTSVDD